MKIKLLTISTLTLAFTAFTHAQTDPYLVGCRSQLPSFERIRDPKIATLFEVWKNKDGVLQSSGYLELNFKNLSGASFVLSVRNPLGSFEDNGVTSFLRGRGTLKNITTNTTTEVYCEWYAEDHRKVNSGPNDPADVLAIHFWKPNTDLDFKARWNFEHFHSVEIYRPVL